MEIDRPIEADTDTHEPVGADARALQQPASEANRLLYKLIRHVAAWLDMGCDEAAMLQIDESGSQAVTAEVDAKDMALVPEDTPAVLPKALPDKGLQIGHLRPPFDASGEGTT
jgi:hypothetical protein